MTDISLQYVTSFQGKGLSGLKWSRVVFDDFSACCGFLYRALLWRYNGCDGVSNHQPHHCLLNRLFRCSSKKASKLRVTGLWAGNSPVTSEFPAQMASNAENAIWWRHHGTTWLKLVMDEVVHPTSLYGCNKLSIPKNSILFQPQLSILCMPKTYAQCCNGFLTILNNFSSAFECKGMGHPTPPWTMVPQMSTPHTSNRL